LAPAAARSASASPMANETDPQRNTSAPASNGAATRAKSRVDTAAGSKPGPPFEVPGPTASREGESSTSPEAVTTPGRDQAPRPQDPTFSPPPLGYALTSQQTSSRTQSSTGQVAVAILGLVLITSPPLTGRARHPAFRWKRQEYSVARDHPG
jgi:hypothetical protein